MNERIRELAEQAEYYAEYTTPQGLEWFNTFKEKFAELIVQKCADIGNKAWKEDGEYTYIGDKIKEHFGVEE
jgi:hypothetical protein